MDWINLQLQKLRKRHQHKAKQIAKQQQAQTQNTSQKPVANSNQAKVEQNVKQFRQTMQKHGASSLKEVKQIKAPSAAGTKPSGNYSPKGLPTRSNSKGKGVSR